MSSPRWVLVTGGARRLGRAVALAAAKAGWNVAIQYRSSRNEAEGVAREIESNGVLAAIAHSELSGEDSGALIESVSDAARAPLSALINCAAIFEHDTAEAIDAAAFEQHMRVNALAPSLLMAAFAKALPQTMRGAIVNFLDYKLAAPYPDHFSYTLSKYALLGATEMAARAFAPRVRVNAVAPGYVLPAPGQSEDDYKRLHAQTPLQRGATPDDIAAACLFLLENQAVTGQTLFVDSGLRFSPQDRDFMFR
jgi:NAD(P)-dependent dehydrogenase (short-subunit alcohol dehydrogenase family)